MAEVLLKKGWDVFIVTSDRGLHDGSRLEPYSKLSGVCVYRYRHDHPFSYYYSCYKVIKKLVDSQRFAFVLSRSHITTICAMLAGVTGATYLLPATFKLQNAKKFNSTWGLLKSLKYSGNVMLQKLAINWAPRNYVFSEIMEAQVKSLAPKVGHIGICKPGVDPLRFFSVANNDKFYNKKQIGINPDMHVALCLGRFAKVKGFDIAIGMARHLGPDWVLVLVGDGPEKGALISQVENMGLQGKVRIFPATDQPEGFYQIADVFIMPSLYEPLGQVMLEASFSGLPVVAFDPGSNQNIQTATREVYRDFPDLVHFAHAFSEQSLAEGVGRAASGFSEAALLQRQEFIERYSWENTVAHLLHAPSNP
tara:strand:- start:6006 stop:7100 length:1095 start_codon:yes stop_codon:yes gene_type:complete